MVRMSRETIQKCFLIFRWRKATEMLGLRFCGLTGLVLLKVNLFNIIIYCRLKEKLRFYHSTAKIARQHIIKELTGKKHLYALRAFYIT